MALKKKAIIVKYKLKVFPSLEASEFTNFPQILKSVQHCNIPLPQQVTATYVYSSVSITKAVLHRFHSIQ